MHVTPFHQTKHLPRQAAHLQRFTIERALKWIERAHDISNGAKAMNGRVGRFGLLCAFSQTEGLVSRTICSQKSTPTKLS
jgi:hypothetical protein